MCVKAAQRLGFSLDRVVRLLRLEDGTHERGGAGLAAQPLTAVRVKLVDFNHIAIAPSTLLSECPARCDNVCGPLISAGSPPAKRVMRGCHDSAANTSRCRWQGGRDREIQVFLEPRPRRVGYGSCLDALGDEFSPGTQRTNRVRDAPANES
jgi:hypothetical protein